MNLKLLFIILDEGYDKRIKYFLNSQGVKIKTVSNARGTASSSILNYFGLTETQKDIFLAIINGKLSQKILGKLEYYFNLNKKGRGLAFTIPISSSNKFLADSLKSEKIERSDFMQEKNNEKVHLIITIVKEGYLETVMNAAKKAGATGGTTIKGRGLNDIKRAKILGFDIEPEKDIVFNIVSEKDKNKVMESITKEAGIKTEGLGVCFSLPVEEIVGIDL